MTAKTYKYIVSIERDKFNSKTATTTQGKYESFEFVNADPLVARDDAFEKADKTELSFENDEQSHKLPMVKYGDGPASDNITVYMYYKVMVDFVQGDEYYTIYTSGDWDHEDDVKEMLSGLQKEYSILNKHGIDLKENTEVIKYYDYADKTKKTANVIPNGMDWTDTKINYEKSEEYKKEMDKLLSEE